MDSPRITSHWLNENALLLRFALTNDVQDANAQVLRAYHCLNKTPATWGIRELVPAACTLLVLFEAVTNHLDTLAAALTRHVGASTPTIGPEPETKHPHTIKVRYGGDDGLDLPHVAAATGMDIDDVIACHSAVTYTVGFLGFVPGFPYLLGLPPRLRLPRLASPRVHVPAGAVAMADQFTGIYPQRSPGGWHLLGITEQILFSPKTTPPTLLQPGDLVRFVPL